MTARVSMADVARRAGVSGQTVSRVVNASPRVDPDTRERVERVMRDLGYRPHRAARTLRTGRSNTIGVIVATLATVGNSRMLESVAAAAARQGLAVTLVTLAADTSIEEAFANLQEAGVDGAIVLNEASALLECGEPLVGLAVVAVDAPSSGFATVHSDHAGGAREAVTRLLERGATSVHHVAGPATSFAAAERERGWEQACSEAGAVRPEVLRGDWGSGSGYDAGCVLAVRPEVQAVFVANDQMALGVLRALAERGRSDVAVIGFDDVADAAQYQPPLTTIRQDFDALGSAAVAALLAEGVDGTHRHTVVPTTLIARVSG